MLRRQLVPLRRHGARRGKAAGCLALADECAPSLSVSPCKSLSMPLRSLLFVPAQEPFELISQLQDRAREVDFTARATFVILL